MDLRQLRYFVTVASERNFTRAAERLHMAQPPLSRQIQQLEAELGMALFNREARPLTLTPMGHLFLEQANQVLARVDALRSMMAGAALTTRRRFVMGYVASTIYARLPALIRQFRKAAPEVDLHLVEVGSLEQVAALKDGKIDVGFGRIRFEDAAVRRTVLREEKLVLAVAIEHPLAQGSGPVSLAEIARHPQILYPSAPRPSYADQVLSHFQDQGLAPPIAHEARELQIAIGLVAAEEGVCVVPESVRKSRVDDVCYRDIAEVITSPIIMSHRINDISPELQLMAQVIARTYGEWGYAVPQGIARFDGAAP
jgi:DNA-binding transcriptional LysR family regulator